VVLQKILDRLRELENPRERKFTAIDTTSTTTVLAGASETITVMPPTGKVYKILSIRYEVSPPTGATSGNHYGTVYGTIFKWLGIRLISAYNVKINYWSNDPTGTTSSRPPTAEALILALNNIYGTRAVPIYIVYENFTDADQTNKRTLQLALEIFTELP